ncbi:Zinc transporter 9 [Collichthys lucidus]|uniref:Zinc transporter 9 n=1 Tax=Collichthys lucidus TaxID=240159 RepID=A0A4U5UCG2_COLLU|nr:Zinc transporter 9 [Collichthys lucidus]
MFPSLAHRPWHVFCRVSLQHRAPLSQRSPRIPQLCYGWQSGGMHSSWFSLPDCRVASLGLGKVQYYSTSGNSKDGPPKPPSANAPSAEKVLSAAVKATPASPGSMPQGLTKAETIQVKVRAVLKKREYGAKYTQNNFITAVRAMNEFCLKPSNGLNFFFKLLAWVYTGSASMFSEAIHSLADTCNQALLALGISQSVRNPDAGHPYGFSNMRYIASLISGVGIFMMGAGLSWYHGIMGLLHPEPIQSLLWAYCILAGSLVSEGATLLVAVNEIKKSARLSDVSFYEYVMQSRDPSTNVVLLEDAAAVLGVILAASCMGLTSLTGNPHYDSLGSLGVGTLLGAVSAFLIYTNTEALLGRSIQAERVQKLTEFLENDPAVRAIHDVKATDIGLSKVRFKAEVDFDGRVVTRSYLEKQDIDQILTDIQQVKTPEELENFMLKHGENIIDTLGAEVDRLEKELKQRNPEVRHVDLEIL